MTQERPVIAISGRCETASWGNWTDVETAILSWHYVRAVQEAGAEVLILPPGGGTGHLRRADGLILAGGADVHSQRYGAPLHQQAQVAPEAQDDLEFGLLAEALVVGLPVLGVCRGMQILTVASGGTLIQHLPDVIDAQRHLGHNGGFGHHDVSLVPRTKLAKLYGCERMTVRTLHHQAADTSGSLTVSARADDGIIEAVEDPNRPFVVGVQWHPEVDNESELFGQLVEHARKYAGGPD